jgi:esterase/lipase
MAVYCARMRGHGTNPDDLAIRSWDDWYDSVNRAYVIMKNSYKKIAIVGFSTGSGIALFQAANKENKFSSAVSISAPLLLHNFASKATPAVNFWNKMLNKLHLKKGKLEFVPNHPENPDINYTRNPVSGVNEMIKLMKTVEEHLHRISTPVLVVQGSKDPVVRKESADKIYKGLRCKGKEILEVKSDRHCIIRGPGSEFVFEKVYDFLIKNFKSGN